MNDKEIDEAIESNPGGSNLEIALAIGSDEDRVAKRRKVVERAEELRKLQEENAAKAAALAKEKAEAAAAKARADQKQDPGHGKTQDKCGPDKKRYYFRDNISGSGRELVLVENLNKIIIFEAKPQSKPV